MLYKLFKEREYSDIFEHEHNSDSKIKVKILSCEQMKNKMSLTTVACSIAYGQSQVLRDIFNLLASLALMLAYADLRRRCR